MCDKAVRLVLFGNSLRFFSGILHTDGHAKTGSLGANDITIQIVAHIAGLRRICTALFQCVVIDGRMRLSDQTQGRLLYGFEIRPELVAVEPFVHFVDADQITMPSV